MATKEQEKIKPEQQVFSENIEELNKQFANKAKRMRETHLVCLEVFIDRLAVNDSLDRNIYGDLDNLIIRIKFADFPCMEIDCSHKEDYIVLETASIRCLRSIRTKNRPSLDRDFFRNGRVSLLPVAPPPPEDIEENIRNTVAECDQLRQSQINYLPIEQIKGVRRSKAMIFPVTPYQLSHYLINKTLNFYIFNYINDNTAKLIATTSVPLYDISDIVSHMIALEGGVYSISKKEGTFQLSDLVKCSNINYNKNNEKCVCPSVPKKEGNFPMPNFNDQPEMNKDKIGSIRVKILLSTYGTNCCANLYNNENMNFVFDEVIEDSFGKELPTVETDVARRLPIITGDEHSPIIEPSQKPSTEPDLPFMCCRNWREILDDYDQKK